MKLVLLSLLFVLPVTAATEKKVRDKINTMTWDGESYTVQLNNFQRPIKISGKNAVIPCLENAQRSEMEVLVTIDSDIPMIKSCKLFSQSLPVPETKQAQEQKPE